MRSLGFFQTCMSTLWFCFWKAFVNHVFAVCIPKAVGNRGHAPLHLITKRSACPVMATPGRACRRKGHSCQTLPLCVSAHVLQWARDQLQSPARPLGVVLRCFLKVTFSVFKESFQSFLYLLDFLGSAWGCLSFLIRWPQVDPFYSLPTGELLPLLSLLIGHPGPKREEAVPTSACGSQGSGGVPKPAHLGHHCVRVQWRGLWSEGRKWSQHVCVLQMLIWFFTGISFPLCPIPQNV